MSQDRRIEKLTASHHVENFDCGKEPLNRFLLRHALQAQRMGASQTYLGFAGEDLVGYFTLAAGSALYDDVPERLAKGMPKHPIPLMVLARLAVDSKWQRRGVGTGLLKEAVLRTLQAADHAGIRGIALHAKDDELRAYYELFGFASSPSDVYHMLVLLKDIKAALGIDS